MSGLSLSTRKDEEARELLIKSKNHLYALSTDSKGRSRAEAPCKRRTAYQRDHDRIIYSNCYRALRYKTQVYMYVYDPKISTRSTHTAEVSQIGARIAQYTNFNVDLVIAGCNGHDVGHVPFGHLGERVLTDIMRVYLGDPFYVFDHATYGVYLLENVERDGVGCNLSAEVKDAILHHSAKGKNLTSPDAGVLTQEAIIVRLADKIAYTCSDLDEAIQYGVIREDLLPQSEIKVLGSVKPKMIHNCIKSVVESTEQAGRVSFEGEVCDAFMSLKSWMYKNVYGKWDTSGMKDKAREYIIRVFNNILETEFKDLDQKYAARNTLDVVAQMTDISLIEYYNKNFVI